jgi:aminomuconate-semialdehyde/2-hydroxymuconate-6-semialdehyde dehydrogenase
MTAPLQLTHLIGDEARASSDGAMLFVHEPATGAAYAQCPVGTAADVEAAVSAANAAFPAWSALSGEERAGWLHRLANAIDARMDDFVAAESRDAGKPLKLVREVEIPRAALNLRFFASAASQFASESHHGQAGLNYTLRQALGAVACISPWNLPLYLFTWKIAPALAAGNCVVAKPSEITPASAWMLGELAREIGFPPGVLNIVHGLGTTVGKALVEHAGIKAMSFTGSTAVGKQIAAHCGPALKKVSLELGGKNPTIVLADAFEDAAQCERMLDTVVRSAFQNSGQICLCGSRILVERRIYDAFRDAFVARVKKLRTGDPLDPSTDLGPLVSQAHFDKVLGCIATARAEGGRVLCGGEALHVEGRCANGWFVAPTVIEGLGPDCCTNTEEIFGPVVTLQAFDDDAQALALANSTPYGLAASVWTQKLDRAHRIGARLQAGIVWINTWLLRDLRTPFGGVGQSGLGREGGHEAMRFFTEAKNICLKLD